VELMADSDAAAALCREASGTGLAFVRSREIRALLTGQGSVQADAWVSAGAHCASGVTACVGRPAPAIPRAGRDRGACSSPAWFVNAWSRQVPIDRGAARRVE